MGVNDLFTSSQNLSCGEKFGHGWPLDLSQHSDLFEICDGHSRCAMRHAEQ